MVDCSLVTMSGQLMNYQDRIVIAHTQQAYLAPRDQTAKRRTVARSNNSTIH
jgi:hypothetical protein